MRSDTWQTLHVQEDGHLVVVRIRSAVPPGILQTRYPIVASIYWPVDPETASGMPTDRVLDKMLEMEDRLGAMDGPAIGFMMFSITGNQRKEWTWYVQDADAFLSALGDHLADMETLPMNIETGPAGDDWDAYELMSASAVELEDGYLA